MPDTLVLCYHAVSARWPAPLAIQPARLEEQLSGLLARGYRPTTFTQASAGEGSDRQLVVTFDDAFQSVFELALPILEKLDVPATVFVPTAYPDSGEIMAWAGLARWQGTEFEGELACMSWDELRALRDRGWEIGAHTVSHPLLTRVDDARLASELIESRERCGAEMGTECTAVAYPYGDVDERVAQAAFDAGFVAGADLGSHFLVDNAMRIPRVGAYQHDTPRRFALKASRQLRHLRRYSIWDRADGGKASRRSDLQKSLP